VRWPALAAGALALALLTGCAQSVDPIERLGTKAAQRVRQHGPPGTPEPPYRRWGLPAPLLPAPKPSRARPARTPGRGGLPPVVSRVRTRDRVVFLTYDVPADDVRAGEGGARRAGGTGKDPRFTDMVRELRLPVSVFLPDGLAGPAHAHVARLRSAGASVQNRTRGRRTEICRMQDAIEKHYGTRPRLFRPPHGTYDTATLSAAAGCGISALVLWRAAMTATGDLTYTRGPDRLRPGDIVALDPDGTRGLPLRRRTSRLLSRVQEAGLTVGRLEDYV
jgi:Polysaccharide deacetylase